jgi:hypothetical protein
VQLAERFAKAGIPFPGAMAETQTCESGCGFIRLGVGMGLLDLITAERQADGDIELRRLEPEVFQSIFLRYKDLRAWSENQHINRPGGVESAAPTAWVPQSKPIWFTEFGCRSQA